MATGAECDAGQNATKTWACLPLDCSLPFPPTRRALVLRTEPSQTEDGHMLDRGSCSIRDGLPSLISHVPASKLQLAGSPQSAVHRPGPGVSPGREANVGMGDSH